MGDGRDDGGTDTRSVELAKQGDERTERDSMGEFRVPADAYYGAQTMRAVVNFPISGLRFPRSFICAIGQIKLAAAQVNAELGLLDDGSRGPLARLRRTWSMAG